MDELVLYDLADLYAEKILNSDDFKRFVELNKIIKKELSKEILSFKREESIYNDASKYGKYHPDLKKYQVNLSEAKRKLYSNPLMIEYKKLELKIQSDLNNDFNELKKSISNKLEISKINILK